MIEICKILFDMCFYYTLSGYFLYLTTLNTPLVWSFVFLMLAAAVYLTLRKNKRVTLVRILCCVIPGLFFITGPSIFQIIQHLPAWGYLSYTIWTNRIYTTRMDFNHHFKFTAKLYGFAVFGVVAFYRLGGAITNIVPYLIAYLLIGVFLLRVLREDGKLRKGGNIAVLLVVLAVSVALALLQTPQLILEIAGFIYRNIISWLILGSTYIVGAIVYGIIWLLSAVFRFQPGGETPAESEGTAGDPPFVDAVLRGVPEWLEIAAIALLVLAVVFTVYMILRRMLGNRKDDYKEKAYTEELERLHWAGKNKKGGLFRPKEPRLAIRWYYRKYIKEGVSKGVGISTSDTSLCLLWRFRDHFPDPVARELRSLYIAARYRYSREITKADADVTAKTWRRLKQGP